jgi:hypothetical protein
MNTENMTQFDAVEQLLKIAKESGIEMTHEIFEIACKHIFKEQPSSIFSTLTPIFSKFIEKYSDDNSTEPNDEEQCNPS